MLVLLAACHLHTADAPAAAPISGTFSDLTYHQESGDLLGTEVHITFSFQGFVAVVHCASGVPVVVPVSVSGQEIAFTLTELHEDSLCGEGSYTGRVDDAALTLRESSSPEYTKVLKRQQSYWDARNRID